MKNAFRKQLKRERKIIVDFVVDEKKLFAVGVKSGHFTDDDNVLN